MTFNIVEYQKFTDTTAMYPGANTGNRDEIVYLSLLLGAEAGETLNVVQKYFRNAGEKPLEVSKLRDELGDVMYAVSRLLKATGITLEEVIAGNVSKLSDRMKQGTIKNR